MVPLSQLLEMQRRLQAMTVERDRAITERDMYKHLVDRAVSDYLATAPVAGVEAPTGDDLLFGHDRTRHAT